MCIAFGLLLVVATLSPQTLQPATRGVAYFNLACGYAKLGQKEKDIEALTNAVSEGYTRRSAYETDADLAPLHSEPRFQELLRRLPQS